MLWGRIADSSRFGRKTVLMIGLAGTCEYLLGEPRHIFKSVADFLSS
jgi:hypothetical protein